ncbi:MAG: SDR family oxidoreductase [Candidatus Cloacimonetes bacterium]|nr:SDR family oxidoreductase [Candidatus Cloacimonadota bacterium]
MKNILVTGVSKGLGFEIAQVILESDNCVWGVSRTRTGNIEKLLNKYPNSFKWKEFDLKNVQKTNDELFKNFINFDIKLHGYVNNAALAYDDIISNLQLEPLEIMYKVNVFSPMMITKYVIRNMLLHRIKGSIIHISSISVHTGYKGLAMYASTKGALEAFSKNTAREWGIRGICSNCIVAGFMETAMSSSLTQEQKNRIFNRTSLKKATNPKSVAETVNFLLTDKATSITGQNIFVDSGTI